jgi:hypothetical protein
MNRRSIIKSLLSTMVGVLVFKKADASLNNPVNECYKGKKLIVTTPDSLEAMCKKREIHLPRFKPNKSIMDEMRMFFDMSEGHRDVCGCIHEDGSHSVISFSNLPCRNYMVR